MSNSFDATHRESVEGATQSVQATLHLEDNGELLSPGYFDERSDCYVETDFAKACTHEGEMTPNRKSKTNFREECL